MQHLKMKRSIRDIRSRETDERDCLRHDGNGNSITIVESLDHHVHDLMRAAAASLFQSKLTTALAVMIAVMWVYPV